MKANPPKRALQFLRWFCREDYIEEIEGDLTEVFEKQYQTSPGRARRKFFWSVIKYFRPGFIKSFRKLKTTNMRSILFHNLLISFRNFSKHKVSFIINLIGLSTALASSSLIGLWIKDEMSVDRFHENGDRIFHVMEHRLKSGGIWTAPSSPGPMAEALVTEMPEIDKTVTITMPREVVVGVPSKNIRATGIYASHDFFRIFSFKIIRGREETALRDKRAIVLSESMAVKFFDTVDDAMGQMISLEAGKQFLVTGILADVPASSSLKFDFVISFLEFKDGRDWLDNWDATAVLTYAMLEPGTSVGEFNNKIRGFIKEKTNNAIAHRTPFLKLYTDGYLYGNYVDGVQTGGRITYVRLFSIVAIFIMAIACINFMNLSTARASRRLKEIGIKKAAGAGRNSLFFQFITESVLVSLVSLTLAILVIVMVLPHFNELVDKQLKIIPDAKLVLGFLAAAVVVGLIAGVYPALYLSGFQPLSLLKSKQYTSFRELWSRKGLVGFQFVISISFLVLVVVVYKQMQFFQSKDLGYDRKNIIYFQLIGNLRETSNQEALLAEMKELPGIVNASSMSHDMTGHNGGTYNVFWEGKDPDDKTEFERATINYDMLETFGIRMAEGRTFSRNFGDETSKIIFNEAAIKFMGLKNPIGKTVRLGERPMEIIGVAGDFHFESLHQAVKPMFFRLNLYDTYLLSAKLAQGTEYETLRKLEGLFKKFNPGFPFDYQFMDEDYRSQYAAEQRVETLSKYFAVLAIVISCLGLFGLAAFTTERRTKEIGIRKVLGSSEFGIVYLLSFDFTKIVLASICLALPISYIAAKSWLATFAFHIDLQWWFFVAAGAVAWSIAWLTVGVQTIKAARINPINCLRSE